MHTYTKKHTHTYTETHAQEGEYKHRMQPIRLHHFKTGHKGRRGLDRLDTLDRFLLVTARCFLRNERLHRLIFTARWRVKQFIPPGARGHAGCTRTRSEDAPSCSSRAASRTWTPFAGGSGGQQVRWMSSAAWFMIKSQKHVSHVNAIGDSYLQFEGLHRVPVLVVEKSSEFGPFIV